MTQQQRYLEAILFGNPDRIPLNPGEPRESTLSVWVQQGMPNGINYLEAAFGELGIDEQASIKTHNLEVSSRMIPEFEPVILQHNDGHYVIKDWMGAITEISDKYDESYLRSARDFVTRKWHKFPVETKKDWEEMKTRFNSDTPGRVCVSAIKKYLKKKEKGYITSLSFNGVFWQLREWCGFENLCIMMADNPDFVHEMAEFWSNFISGLLDRILSVVKLDRVSISEDMAFKAHSMISPAMTREFILPAYNLWLPKIRENGCPVVELDSDGYIEELIPIWIEAGINCCSPVEVAAHCDILRFRRKFGKNMAYMQGIDKRAIAIGGSCLKEHVMSIVPALFKDGGYIPGCDHGVPPDISWENYLEFVKLLAKLSGWL